MSVKENLRIVSEMDEALNKRDWNVFNRVHAENMLSYNPSTTEPTRGLKLHREEFEQILSAFPDMKMTREHIFGQGEWVFARYTLKGTHKGPFPGPDGKMISPTERTIIIPYAWAVRFEKGKIAEEHNYYDQLAMLTQLGIKL